MPPKPVYTDKNVISEIFERRKAGMSIRDIAQMVGIPKSTVHRILGVRPCDKKV